jgi:hypothetical protein
METKVLTVNNTHVPACGPPPNLSTGRQWYTAYFENADNEQLVFRYDRQENKGLLWHGDLTWNRPFEVKAGRVPGLILDPCEIEWLKLVWRVATGVGWQPFLKE